MATGFVASTMQTQIAGMQNLNEQDYLRSIADGIVSSSGVPTDWGSSGTVPSNLGLAAGSSRVFELDVDKVSRLNSLNNEALSYLEVLNAARLSDIAFGATITQMLTVNVALSGNSSVGNEQAYNFTVTVMDDCGPQSASLSFYLVAKDFLVNTSSSASSTGQAIVTFQIPNSSNGSALLVVFARSTFDDRITAYQTFPFAHLSNEPSPSGTYLSLSPLDSVLTLTKKIPSAIVQDVYGFSYAYQSNSSSVTETTYDIPALADNSPIVLVAQGTDGGFTFQECTSYPQVPLEVGADLSNSDANVFSYLVTVDGTLYRLNLRFGDVVG